MGRGEQEHGKGHRVRAVREVGTVKAGSQTERGLLGVVQSIGRRQAKSFEQEGRETREVL